MNTSPELTAVAEILAELAEVDPSDVTAEANLKLDFDVDSLLMVEIVVAIEERFGITVPDEAATQFETPGDLARFVSQRAAA